ncbi:UGSC family (seleno)protein [Pseudonocardia sp.]|jgi:hypothetical protein|uniref:UGSC family (seleno)protein n=1 Tax=Pseudonocardia sp. TaxID=60912 RepID=UPI003D136BED
MTENEIIDPRMPGSAPLEPAAGTGSVSGKKVLLFDNGKIRSEYGSYDAAFELFAEELTSAGATVQRRSVDLLGGGGFSEPALQQLAASIAGSTDAVIIGLADAGVSAPSVVLAAHLEGLGIPTGVICQGVGTSVVRTMASFLVPGLPIHALRVWRLSAAEDVRVDAKELWPDVLAGVVRTGDGAPRAAGSVSTGWRLLDVESELSDGEFTEVVESDGFGDGLPLIAPRSGLVSTMVEAMGAPADDVVWAPVGARRSSVVVRDVAAIAVMAGCRPAVGRIVLEAFRCMAAAEFRLFQAAITAHPSGTLVLVSGPAADAAGMNSGYGCLGPGSRANATIGRAVALSYGFLLGMRPGHGDIGVQGSPAEYSFCVAENVAESPWSGLNEDIAAADSSVVLVLRAEGGHNVLDHTSRDPLALLGGIADTASSLGGNNLYSPGAQTVIVLNPEHARILAEAGWSKRDVQMFIFENARRQRSDLEGRGITPNWKPWVGQAVPIVENPDDVVVVVAGAPGPQSQVIVPWGYSRGVARQFSGSMSE